MSHCCIEGERVGDDSSEVVGVDCGDDDGRGGTPVLAEARGREPPSLFFFFLDLHPRWEKGFPSVPWPPLQDLICFSVSLCVFPSVSAFPDSGHSPFLKFPEIRNSDWAEILTRFYLDISFLAPEEGHQPPYGLATRV